MAGGNASAAAGIAQRVLAVLAFGRNRLPEGASRFARHDLEETLAPQVAKDHRRVIAGPHQAIVADGVVRPLAAPRAPAEVEMLVASDIDHTRRNRHRD